MKAITFDVGTLRYIACKSAGLITPRAYWSVLSGLRLREVPEPSLPTPTWVKLRPILAGICGTDLSTIMLRTHPASYLTRLAEPPFGLGHECVAVVEEVGKAVSGWLPGDRVVVEPSLSCAVREIDPPCPECTVGLFTLCRNTHLGTIPPAIMLGYNNFTGGTWGERFVAHQWQLHRVPDSLPDEQAVLTDPLACALHGVLRHRPADADRVLVQGAGIIAMGVTMCLRALGCRAEITALVRRDRQADLARKLGADHVLCVSSKLSPEQRYDLVAEQTGGRRLPGRFGNQGFVGGYDVVYNCVGGGASLTDAAKFTRARGTLVLLGTGTITVTDTTTYWFKELNIVGCNGRRIAQVDDRKQHTYAALFELVEQGACSLGLLSTRVFPLTAYRSALRFLSGENADARLKSLLMPDYKPAIRSGIQ